MWVNVIINKYYIKWQRYMLTLIWIRKGFLASIWKYFNVHKIVSERQNYVITEDNWTVRLRFIIQVGLLSGFVLPSHFCFMEVIV